MHYMPGLPNNPPTQLIEAFSNKPKIDVVDTQLNFVIGTLINVLQNKAAKLDVVKYYWEVMVTEDYFGAVTMDYLNKGIDYCSFCVAIEDMSNLRNGWPKRVDEFVLGMSAAFAMSNVEILNKIPASMHNVIGIEANTWSTKLVSINNFVNSGSIMYNQFAQYPQPYTGGVQQVSPNGMQQNPWMAQQQAQLAAQQQQQLMMQQAAMQQAALQQAQFGGQMMPNMGMPFINQQVGMPQFRPPMMPQQQWGMQQPMMGMQPQFQAPTTGFVQNQAYGYVTNDAVGTTKKSSYGGGNAVPQQQYQQPVQNPVQQQQIAPQHVQLPQTNVMQPQPTAQVPQQQVTNATIVHGGQQQPINLTQQVQPVNNGIPQYIPQPVVQNPVEQISVEVTQPVSQPLALVPAQNGMRFSKKSGFIPLVYDRSKQILKVIQDNNGIVQEQKIEIAKMKYEEHESQRILPNRTIRENKAYADAKSMNAIIERSMTDISMTQILEQVNKDRAKAGEEIVNVSTSDLIIELGNKAARLENPIYTLSKEMTYSNLTKAMIDEGLVISLTDVPVVSKLALLSPWPVSGAITTLINELNETDNLANWIDKFNDLAEADIESLKYAWIHDHYCDYINKVVHKRFGMPFQIENVQSDLNDLIDAIGQEYDNDTAAEIYVYLHQLLTEVALRVIDDADANVSFIGTWHMLLAMPINSCSIPYNIPGKAGLVDRSTHTRLAILLDKLNKEPDIESVWLTTIQSDIIEISSTTIAGNYVMYSAK